MFEQIPIGTLFSNVLSELRGQAERTRAAARSLCEAAWDYQRAVWLFASVHQYGVARAVRDIAEVESQAVGKMDAASREFTKDYDWPEDLRKTFTKEIQQINLETANVKAFSMTGQYDDMKRSAQQIENACERIRTAARPHTLGLWRRVRELRAVTPAGGRPSITANEKRGWKTWWGQLLILIATGVTAGLVIWAVTRHYDRPTPSASVAQQTIQPKPQAPQPEAKPQDNAHPESTSQPGVRTKKVKIEPHKEGNEAVGGSITTGPCSNVQVGGNGNQATTNCGQLPLELTPSLRLIVPPHKGRFQFKPEECPIKTQIRIVPNQKVPPPIQISLEFDNPVTKIAATVEGANVLMTGGRFRSGVHAMTTIASPGIGPNNPLLVEVCSALPVKLIAPPRVD